MHKITTWFQISITIEKRIKGNKLQSYLQYNKFARKYHYSLIYTRSCARYKNVQKIGFVLLLDFIDSDKNINLLVMSHLIRPQQQSDGWLKSKQVYFIV